MSFYEKHIADKVAVVLISTEGGHDITEQLEVSAHLMVRSLCPELEDVYFGKATVEDIEDVCKLIKEDYPEFEKTLDNQLTGVRVFGMNLAGGYFTFGYADEEGIQATIEALLLNKHYDNLHPDTSIKLH